MKYLSFAILLATSLLSCQNAPNSQQESKSTAPAPYAQPAVFTARESNPGLGKAWYQGKAEISSYELQQNRYRGLHPGEAVLIFVTEDFLTDKQVKNETYTNPNSTPVLKLNHLRKFPTGLYTYSTMSSVFTPTRVDQYPQTLKVSTSVQDWCGHAYLQLNFRDGQYQSVLHSYFEQEADQREALPYAILEDELFNRIRINPEGLPTGKLQVIPGTKLLRLLHLPMKAVEAEASLTDYTGADFEGSQLRAYRLRYPSLQRTLEIVFQKEAPHRIEGWTDAYPSLSDKTVRTTLARRKKTIWSPYWQKNSLEDMALREELGLEVF